MFHYLNVVRFSRLFGSPSFIGHYQLKHKSSYWRGDEIRCAFDPPQIGEKKEEIWLSPATKSPQTDNHLKKTKATTQNATKTFDYTIADILRTVCWRDSSHPTHARIPEGGDRGSGPPPPLRFVRGGVLHGCLMGRRGGPKVVFIFLL